MNLQFTAYGNLFSYKKYAETYRITVSQYFIDYINASRAL